MSPMRFLTERKAIMKKLALILALLTLFVLVCVSCDKNDALNEDTQTVTDTDAITTDVTDEVTTDETDTTDTTAPEADSETTAIPTIDDFFSMMESNTAEEVTHAIIDFSATADITVNSKGMSQTNSMTASGSYAHIGDSSALSLTLPGYDDPTDIILHDKLYVSTPDLGKLACEASATDLRALLSSLMGGDSEAEELDPSAVPGLEVLLASLATIKPSELFASSSFEVDPATGAYTLVMSGLSDKAIQTIDAILAFYSDMEGDAEDSVEDEMYGEADVLTTIKTILTSWMNPENLKITAIFDKEFKLTKLDLLVKADISAFVTSDPTEGTASMALNMSINVSYEKPSIQAPADADSYESITLDELVYLLFGGGMEDEYQYVYGTVANVSTDGEGNTVAVLVYDDYDDDWNKIEVEQLVLVPEELVELVNSLKGCEVYATVLDSVLVDIELDVETEVAFTTVKDIATVDGITTLTLNVIVDYDENGNEIFDALTITVPEELVSDVTAIAVGSNVVVEFIFDENGNATLISIDELTFVED